MMVGFLDRMFGRGQNRTGSSSKAKERLQFVLVHDRIHMPPERMEAMKQEILAVISKYVSIDDKNVEIALHQRDRSSLLVAEIPFLKALEGVEPEEEDLGILPMRKTPDVKATEAKAVEAKPADTKPVDVKPADVKPVEEKPAETKLAEDKLAEDEKPETPALDEKKEADDAHKDKDKGTAATTDD
jgi:cell division topological specificity factor